VRTENLIAGGVDSAHPSVMNLDRQAKILIVSSI